MIPVKLYRAMREFPAPRNRRNGVLDVHPGMFDIGRMLRTTWSSMRIAARVPRRRSSRHFESRTKFYCARFASQNLPARL
jgi:hypothetical protein